MNTKSHWENVYATRTADDVSWYREHLDNSLKMVLQTGVQKSAAIIDVGGGSSTLVDDLFDQGFSDVTVLDIAGTALAASKQRLDVRGAQVHWVEADITAV
jgi:ubiquinone/menaquinone biosynthesis C-methylase UbiE